MKTIRMSTAVLGPAALSIVLMFTLNPRDETTASGPIWGRVTYKGRPLQAGAIYFVPVEADVNDPAIGPIGKDGSYSIDSQWRRGRLEKAHFRICIVPFPSGEIPEDRSPAAKAGLGLEIDPSLSPNETSGSGQHMVLDGSVPDRFTRILTSGLLVTLDRESARVDIDLKD